MAEQEAKSPHYLPVRRKARKPSAPNQGCFSKPIIPVLVLVWFARIITTRPDLVNPFPLLEVFCDDNHVLWSPRFIFKDAEFHRVSFIKLVTYLRAG